MALAEHGDRIQVHYRILLEDGSLFDSTFARGPVEFRTGQNKLHRAFEEAFFGMDVGESKTVKLSADEAFGPYLEERIIEVTQDRIARDVDLYKGHRL